ncbi:ATP-dependent helicase [Fusobacterium sp. PH5-44]|uniref:ATP-dependent helicase n=1 Tax=unclassified Fusobacterium TaxID=2648384 RepID=UPI003D226297
MGLLDKLNDKQREAAGKIDGALLILAGAGSGKTRTITYRIGHMIKEVGISPYNILAVTFTNKAAKEMKDRVIDLIGEDGKRALISTFHSFGLRLLRIYGERLGYNSNFTIYDVDDQKRVVKSITKNMTNLDKNITDKYIVSVISKLKEDGTSPEDFSKEMNQFKSADKVIAEVYEKYNRLLKTNNAMDFSDILLNTEKLLNISDILEKIQNKFKYIMVDEYQDTNKIQYNIINNIAKKYGNICVVGDENQSIYGFRGADIQNILSFEKDYKDATIVKLEENYRSTSIILEAANNVIKNNTTSKDKKLWTKKEKGDLISLYACGDGREEVNTIVEEIQLGKSQGKKYKDFTILYRTNAQSRLFEEGFLRYNIPYKIFGGMQFYQRAEIKDILAYLSVINNTQDTLNLTRIINVPKRKIGAKTLEKMMIYCDEKGISLYSALKELGNIGLSPTVSEQLKNLYEILAKLIEMTEYASVSEIFNKLVSSIRYEEYLKVNYEDYEGRIENVDELLNSIIELENMSESLTLREYLENVSLVSATDDLNDEIDYIKMMTIHNSKGLEFPVVFLTGVEDEIFPSKKADFSTADLEEERRLCYVAITRAEEKLYISYARARYVYGDLNYRTRSRFIEEIPKELIISNEDRTIYTSNNRNKDDYNKPKSLETFKKVITADDLNKSIEDFPYNIGEKVMHKKFGFGVVTDITAKKVEIKFVDGKKEIALVVADKFLEKC